MSNPSILLVLTGILIGLNFPLGKIAGDAGISPILWPLLIAVGGSTASAAKLLVYRQLARPSWRVLRFSAISGLISFFAVNLLVFGLIPHVGAGYVGLMFASSPIFTLAFAFALGFRPPQLLGIVGILVGFAGACLVAWSRQTTLDAGAAIWLALAFLIPITLAVGNIYRTIGWPAGTDSETLGVWTNLCAAVAYVVALLIIHHDLMLDQLALAPAAAFLQLLVGGLTFPFYFRLQKYGGPVLLSQLGYVAAAVGLATATLFLGETYSLLTWCGAAVTLVGIGFTIRAQLAR